MQCKIRELNAAGLAAARELFLSTQNVQDPAERSARAREIALDPAFGQEVRTAGFIDLDARFECIEDHTRHIHEALAPAGQGAISNVGIIAFLYLCHIAQLVGPKARKMEAYFLDEKSRGSVRIGRAYRNALWVRLTIFDRFKGNDFILKPLFTGPLHENSDSIERLAMRPAAVRSEAYMMLNIAMFYDQATGKKRRKPQVRGTSRSVKNVKEAMKEFSVVFGQCERNYAIALMPTEDLLAILPDTKGLKPYKKIARRVLEDIRASAASDELAA